MYVSLSLYLIRHFEEYVPVTKYSHGASSYIRKTNQTLHESNFGVFLCANSVKKIVTSTQWQQLKQRQKNSPVSVSISTKD